MLWLQRSVSSVLGTFRAVVARLAHQAEPKQFDDDELPEELGETLERSRPVLSPPADGPEQKQKLYHCFFQLGIRSMTSWYHVRSGATLEESIRLLRTAVSLCPRSASERGTLLFALADVFDERYNIHGTSDDLQNCINLLREVLELYSPGHPIVSGSLSNLANALSARYARFGEVADLTEGIRLYQEALVLHPEGHPDRFRSLNNLANALGYRYACIGEKADMEERVRLLQEALEICPKGHPDRSASLNNLAAALSNRYARLGDIVDLEEQIRLHHEALALRPEGHPKRSSSLNNLAAALSDRHSRLGDITDLEECIRLHQDAFELCPDGHPHRSEFANNLAVALSDRYERLGDISDLEEHIRLHQLALDLCPEGHPDRSGSLNNLAVAFGARYTRLGDIVDLDAQIRLHQEALDLRPKGHPSRSISLNNLAVALSDRYARLRHPADLEEHIRLYQEALSLHPEGHPDRSVSLNNLAVAHNDRYARLREVTDLEECIRLFQEALVLRPEGHPSRSMSLNNLANAICKRYAVLGETADLEFAISYLRSSSTDAFSSQSIILHCAFRWIEIAEEYRHESLGEAFVSAVAGLRHYLSIGPTAELQYAALLRDTSISTLATDAAVYFIEKGDLEQAVELLDEGRALLISEMRRFREPLTRNEQAMIGEELSSRYLNLCDDIRNLSNSEVRFEQFSSTAAAKLAGESEARSDVAYGELVKDKRRKMEEYSNLLHQIRQLPGCKDFQQPRKFEKLKDAAREGPVVVINCSKRRSDVIIIFSHRSPLLITLDEDFFQVMQDTSKCYLESLSQLSATEDIVTAISDILEPVVEQLWTDVVQQVVDALQDNGIEKGSRIWWCPTSFLTSLPFHAAGSCSDWLIDHYVSSYTSTLSALISARQLVNEEPSSPRILVVAQTITSGLKNAGPELREMQKLACFEQYLDEEDATPQSVAEHLPSYDWVHFICHGTVVNDPFDSYLHLYDGNRLTLNDIIKLHMTDAKFAFLAACHSAAQSRDKSVLRDEILHLAAAMQVSGFRSVVGTMWQMQDEDGPRIARKFYEEIFKGEYSGDGRHSLAAHALWKAVRWLKNDSMAEEASGEKRKKKKEQVDGDDEGKERKEKKAKKAKKVKKKKEEIPIARWANYMHIGA